MSGCEFLQVFWSTLCRFIYFGPVLEGLLLRIFSILGFVFDFSSWWFCHELDRNTLFSVWLWSESGCFMDLHYNDESQAFGSALATARRIWLHWTKIKRPSARYPVVKSLSDSSVSYVCDQAHFLQSPLRLTSVTFMPINAYRISSPVLICLWQIAWHCLSRLELPWPT